MLAAVAVAAVAGLALSGCSGSGGAGSEIVIGTSVPLTGALGTMGTPVSMGYQAAIDEINAAGGIEFGGAKHKIKLIIQDNASDPAKAAAQAKSLVLDSKAVALLGPVTPPLSIPEATVAEQLKVPFLTSITPIRAFMGANAGWNYAWDVFFDELQMTETQFQASDLINTNKKVALFTDTEEDGVVMGKLWEENAPKFGYEIVTRQIFPVDQANFSSQVAAVKKSGADIVIAQVIPPEAIGILKEMKAQGYDPKAMFMEKGGNTGNFVKITGGLGLGVMAANWFAEGMGLEREQEFIDKFASKIGGVNSDLGILVCGYSIAYVLADAIKAAGGTDAAKLSEAIGKTNGDYAIGHIEFTEGHAAPLKVIQTQWDANNNQVMVLNLEGKAATPIVTPVAGLK
jgi:branched-chain amino acid transport system substrate-binding protein